MYFEVLFLWNPHIGSDTRWLQEVVFHVVPEGQSGLLFEPVTSGHPRGHFPGKGKPEQHTCIPLMRTQKLREPESLV